MGRDSAERKGSNLDAVDGDEEWLKLPLRFLRSRACAELSPHALKLLVDLMSMMHSAAGRNGDIWPSAEALKVRGWASDATIQAAMRELREARLVEVTRRRRGRRCELIAVTLWSLKCDRKKLDSKSQEYTVDAYRGADGQRFDPPTDWRPAQWRKARPQKATHFPSGSEKAL